MVKHCPTCHRDSKEARFFGEFCEHCMRDKLSKKLKDKIEIVKCKRCGKIYVTGQFMEETDDAMTVQVQREFKGYFVELLGYGDKEAKVAVTENIRGEDLTVHKVVELNWKKTMCTGCTRYLGGYYEAVIQLRGAPSRVQTMMGRISRYFERNSEYVSRIEEVDGGYDVFVSSKLLTAHFLEIQNIKPVISYTLYGLNRGKKVYRNTYAVRL